MPLARQWLLDLHSKECAVFADGLLAELKKRGLKDPPLRVELKRGTTVTVTVSDEHLCEDGAIRIGGSVDTSQ